LLLRLWFKAATAPWLHLENTWVTVVGFTLGR
jgi:hypothetical protein